MSPEKDAPAGAMSDQNREEQHSHLRDDETHPEPRTKNGAEGEQRRAPAHEGSADEDSQATGHPQNAG